MNIIEDENLGTCEAACDCCSDSRTDPSTTCPAAYTIWPTREWIWLSGDPTACLLCEIYRLRGSPLPCVDHDDDGGADGFVCEETYP